MLSRRCASVDFWHQCLMTTLTSASRLPIPRGSPKALKRSKIAIEQ